MAVRYAVGGARILSGILATGQPPLQQVAEEMEKSTDATDKDVASSIKKATGNTSSHKDAVKTFGLACGKIFLSVLLCDCARLQCFKYNMTMAGTQ